MYYKDTFLEQLRETTNSLSLESRSPGQDTNLGPPEYEALMLTTWQLRLMQPVSPLTELFKFIVLTKSLYIYKNAFKTVRRAMD
jgi:hypothetical protein